MFLELCKIFKNEVHPLVVTFGVYSELGYTWVIVLAAFFLMGGYFIIQVVFFRPWGLQNTKNAFYKKMLCDQASDEIIFQIITNHQPRATCRLLLQNRPFVNTQGGDQPCLPLLIAPGSATLPYPILQGQPTINVQSVECSQECSMQDQPHGKGHSY